MGEIQPRKEVMRWVHCDCSCWKEKKYKKTISGEEKWNIQTHTLSQKLQKVRHTQTPPCFTALWHLMGFLCLSGGGSCGYTEVRALKTTDARLDVSCSISDNLSPVSCTWRGPLHRHPGFRQPPPPPHSSLHLPTGGTAHRGRHWCKHPPCRHTQCSGCKQAAQRNLLRKNTCWFVLSGNITDEALGLLKPHVWGLSANC